jgi:hypothetical protein
MFFNLKPISSFYDISASKEHHDLRSTIFYHASRSTLELQDNGNIDVKKIGDVLERSRRALFAGE